MDMKEFLRTAVKNVSRKVTNGKLDPAEEGYDDAEEMLLDWIWIEFKEESPDKDRVIQMDLDDLYELIESYSDIYEDYRIILESLRAEVQ
jgi:hypothetical protein